MLFLPLLFAAALEGEDDRNLVRRLQSRDPHAMANLYDRYGRLAYALILRIVRNTAAAEDLVQETFLRIWNRVHSFDAEKGALGPWVLAVARNRAIDYLRSVDGRMAQSAVEIDKMEQAALFHDAGSDFLNLDRVKLLKGAFQKLTANQRIVLELAYFEGLSQSEMAERMKQPLGSVKTWVRSALKTLREELGATALT
ncbi:MAG: sigma-70 family RNA polymerase sigma factor [Acidobacteriaceae bacterium]|nr:sigma-70 family RNA polymerase sigma factor [Acidobacteriaceae bacterium]